MAASSQPAPKRQTMGSLARRDALTGYLFIAPYLIIAGIFTFGLLFYVFYISFTDLRASFQVAPPQFVGLDNYIRALNDPAFHTSLGNAFWYFLIVTTFQTIGAIFLAVLLNAPDVMDCDVAMLLTDTA